MAVENRDTHEYLVQQFNSSSLKDDKLEEIVFRLNATISNNQGKSVVIGKQIDINHLYEIIFLQNQPKTTFFTIPTLQLLTDLLGKLLEEIPPQEVIQKYMKNIEKSLFLNNEHLQITSLHQVHRLTELDENVSIFLSNPSLISLVFQYLNSKFVIIASLARKILNFLYENKSRKPDWIFSDEILNICRNLLVSGAVKRFRVYEVFVDLLSKHPDYLNSCAFIFDKLIIEILDKNDILCQLNGLEMISHEAFLNQGGMKYLIDKGIFDWIVTFGNTNDSLQNMLLPGVIKLIGNFFTTFAYKIINNYEKLISIIFKHLESHDSNLRCLCAETIALICSSQNGLQFLVHTNLEHLKSAIQHFSIMIKNEKDHYQIRVLGALTRTFCQDLVNMEILLICQTLYKTIDQNSFLFIFNLVKQPFLELRYGGFRLILTLLKFQWFEQDMSFCPGFIEHILNRKTDHEKEGKELKYDIIKKLSTSTTSLQSFGSVFHERLSKYTKEGPFYT